MDRCPICTQGVIDTDSERATQSCQACQVKLGLVPMPAARTRGPCRQCGGRKFLRAVPREHTSRPDDASVSAPMYVTHAPQGYRGAMTRSAKELDIEKGHGLLEVYACFACGAVAWYCRDVEAIPVHPHFMTEIIEE